MRVYITAPIYYRERLLPVLKIIIKVLKREKYEVLSEDILKIPLEEALSTSEKIKTSWYETWRKYVSKADLAVAEISFPGTVHVGFEIASIIGRGKPVICLYQEGKDPVFINELHSSRLIKVSYSTIESLEESLLWALEEARQMFSRRFTFFIPSRIDNFLEELYKKEGISRSEFIRLLIEKEMGKRKVNKK